MQHLTEKGEKLYVLMRGAKFWQGEEDIVAGVEVWNGRNEVKQ